MTKRLPPRLMPLSLSSSTAGSDARNLSSRRVIEEKGFSIDREGRLCVVAVSRYLTLLLPSTGLVFVLAIRNETFFAGASSEVARQWRDSAAHSSRTVQRWTMLEKLPRPTGIESNCRARLNCHHHFQQRPSSFRSHEAQVLEL